jgi:beta-lactamase class A
MKLKFFSLLILIALFSGSLPARAIDSDLPFTVPPTKIKPLRDLVDGDLQARLEKRLKSNKEWARLIKNKKMAVGLVDMSNPAKARFARVNGSQMMYAASLPKLAVLLAAEQSLEDGELKESREVLSDMRIMISKSDNSAATRMIDRIGFDKIESVLTAPEYELYDPDNGGGLWVGKRYAKSGPRYPDPIMGISHGASVTQVCRFYYLLSLGKLVSRHRSIQMLEMMVDPEIHHKFVNSLDHIVPEARVYRKSGSWRDYHADSALVWGPVWRRYIVVALIESPRGEQIARNIIPAVEDVLRPSHN